MTKHFFLIVALAAAHSLHAQPTIKWQKAFGGNGNESVADAKKTSDNGFIVVGSTSATNGDVTGTVQGSSDIWVIKLDSNGNKQWDKTFGGSQIDIGRSIVQTSDGGYVLVGETNSTDGDIQSNHGLYDIWVAKLSSSGSLSWGKCFGGSGQDNARSIIEGGNGDLIVSGRTSSTNGDITSNHGSDDVWVFKTNSTGTIIWQRCYGGAGLEASGYLTSTNDGNYIFSSSSLSNNGDLSANNGLMDLWLVKISPTNSIIWQKNYGGTKNDQGSTVYPTKDGGYIAVGRTISEDGDISSFKDSFDVLVVKVTSTGTLEWAKGIGGLSADFGADITQMVDSNILIVAQTYSNNGDVTGLHGTNGDIWVASLKPNGTLNYQKAIGGTGNDNASVIKMVSDSVYLVGGSTASNDGDASNSGFHTGTSSSYTDMWLLKLQFPIALDIEEIAATMNGVKVYPTVTQKAVHIILPSRYSQAEISLLNLSGQKIQVDDSKSSTNRTINLDNISGGMYILQVMSEGKMNSYKIIYQP